MKKRMILVVVIAVANLARAGANVEQLVEKIKSVNPQDRWMPSGTIEFTYDRTETYNGKDYAYTMVGSATFDGDRVLFRRTITQGEPVPPNIDEKEKGTLVRDLVLLITPRDFRSYVPSLNAMTINRQALNRVDWRSVSAIHDGTVPAEGLARLSAGKMSAIMIGNSLKLDGKDRTQCSIVTDDGGRIVGIRSDGAKGQYREYAFSDHAMVNGKWLPKSITVLSNTATGNKVEYWSLIFKPGTPSPDEFKIETNRETRIQEYIGDGEPVVVHSYGGGPRCQPTTSLDTAVAGNATVALDEWMNYHKCGYPSNDSWHVDCPCTGQCGGQAHYFIHHHHCEYDGMSNCYNYIWVVDMLWDCVWYSWYPDCNHCYDDTYYEWTQHICSVD